jgi:hypothetical protein
MDFLTSFDDVGHKVRTEDMACKDLTQDTDQGRALGKWHCTFGFYERQAI